MCIRDRITCGRRLFDESLWLAEWPFSCWSPPAFGSDVHRGEGGQLQPGSNRPSGIRAGNLSTLSIMFSVVSMSCSGFKHKLPQLSQQSTANVSSLLLPWCTAEFQGVACSVVVFTLMCCSFAIIDPVRNTWFGSTSCSFPCRAPLRHCTGSKDPLGCVRP